ncbi:MAG: hypothetical protein U0610_23390 [bacterium]
MSDIDRVLAPWHLAVWPAPRTPCPVAFVFSRCPGNFEHDPPRNEGLLWLAAELHRTGVAGRIAIPGTGADRTPETTTYPGCHVWTRALRELGVPAEAIVLVPGEGAHTRTEGDDFVRLAKERRWTEALVLMNPHETLRVMLGLLVSFRLFGHPMRATPVTPATTDWNRDVYGSQGELRMARAHHILEEVRRVLAYQAKGDLASLDELDHYYREVLGIASPVPQRAS